MRGCSGLIRTVNKALVFIWSRTVRQRYPDRSQCFFIERKTMNDLKLTGDNRITTIELRGFINGIRTEFGEPAIENRHFLSRVEDELEGELPVVKLLRPKRGGTPMRYYQLTLDQALLVGMRESKGVRRRVRDKLKFLQNALQQRSFARLEAPEMTLALKDARQTLKGKDTKSYHYSNEHNMIYRIVLGVSAAQYRRDNALPDAMNLRDDLHPATLKAIGELQQMNTALIKAGLEYQDRKERLTVYYDRALDQDVVEENARLDFDPI